MISQAPDTGIITTMILGDIGELTTLSYIGGVRMEVSG